jgi:hypothetical protein
LLEAAKALADVEREAVRHAASAGVISTEVGSELLVEIDDRVHDLAEAAHDSESELIAAFDRVFGGGEADPSD